MTTAKKIDPGAPQSIAFPLDEFYARSRLTLPPLDQVDGEAIPEPYKGLLVHERDMTSTLESFHGASIHLRLVSRQQRGHDYFREVVLALDGSEKPVEFGAIRIDLSRFPGQAREAILEERFPLGRLMKDFAIGYRSCPKAYLRVASDKTINSLLGLTGAHLLYGRRNTLLDPAGHSLAEIVEILPSYFSPGLTICHVVTICLDASGVRMNSASHYDVLIIGAGPAGCAAAMLLAEQGHRVLVIEREKFPRYHVGESLLPFTFEPLQRLGLIEVMKQSAFVKKYSVQFVSPSGKASQPFYFFNRYDRETIAQTWQVLRSEFDQMLLDHARSRGAAVIEETTVTALLKEELDPVSTETVPGESGRQTLPQNPGALPARARRVVGVRTQNKSGDIVEYRAPITIDCSGKEAFAAVRQGWRMGDPSLNKVAVWTYYRGAKRDPGLDEGATTVAFVPDKGWFWWIPLHNDMVSVGVVADGKYLTRGGVKAPEAIFTREIEQNLWVKEHLVGGRPTGRYYITSEYTQHAQYCYSEGLLLAGDAFCFLDPVFSSGVMLALKSGVLAADTVHEALLARDFSPGRFAEYGRVLREGIENMRKLVYAFYEPNFSFRTITDKHPELAGLITDCLSGDVNKDFSPLWKAIEEFAPVPEALPYGAPLPKAGSARVEV